MIADSEAAATEVRHILDLFARSYSNAHDQQVFHDENLRLLDDGLNSQIRRQLPAVRAIAMAINSRTIDEFVAGRDRGGGWGWSEARDAADELLGELESMERVARIVGPVGPQLSATGLHPWVWNAAADVWPSGSFRHAVLDAYIRVEQLTQLRTSRQDVSGSALWTELFSLDPPKPAHPRLRFREVRPGTDQFVSSHKGAMSLGMACASGIRNWSAHTLDRADEQEALEYLACLSVLARWVDDADLLLCSTSQPL